MSNLKLIRLLNEELIGEVIAETDKNIVLRNPVTIVVVPSQTDPKNPQVALVPFLRFSDDKELEINRNLIVTTATPIIDFVNQYNSIFGGILIPNSNIITS